MRALPLGILGLALTVTACGKSDATVTPASGAAASLAASGPASSAAIPVAPPTVELKIASVGNKLAYDRTTMTVVAGQPVHLVLKNNATTDGLPRNWVLVKPGTEDAVAAAGLKAGPSKDYIGGGPDILAATPVAMMQGTAAITFKAPDTPGIYPYLCTAPGQASKMKGMLTVTP